jgi:chromosome partitioning protein
VSGALPRGDVAPGRVVAIANQKGGVGKTTTAVNLAAALGQLGISVLLVDLDPQGNASTGIGLDQNERTSTTYDVLTGRVEGPSAVLETPVPGVHAIPATIDLAGAEIEMVSQFSRESRLASALASIRGSFQLVVIDCPPSLGLLTVNGLAAADEVLVPIQCEYYALEGVGQLLRNLRMIRQNVNPHLRLNGIVLTMFDSRTKLAEQVVAEVRAYFGPQVYDAVIPRSVRLSEAPGYGRPIIQYDPSSRGAQAYQALAVEFLARDGRRSEIPGDLPAEPRPAASMAHGSETRERSENVAVGSAAESAAIVDLERTAPVVVSGPTADVSAATDVAARSYLERGRVEDDVNPTEGVDAGGRRPRWPFKRQKGGNG